MKRSALALILAALGGTALQAQDTHQGPVVYPSASAPAADPTQNGLAPDTNMDSAPAASAGNAPGDNAASSVGANPAAPVMGGPSTQGGTANPALNPLAALTGQAGPNAKPDDIQDIRPPFFYLKPLTWLWVLLAALVLASLAVLLWFWLKPLRERRARTAYDLALEKLERARALLTEENAEPYAVLVSETVRTYLGQRFHTPSTRRTTEEFLRQMQADANTPLAAHSDLLRGFLEACDLVKFAHYQPGREELEQVQQRAVSFVTATRPVEGVPA
jgi:hypothetical protein